MNVTPSISVRKLDSNHDPVYGNGQADFLTDIYAVAQIIECALLLFQGEWWNNLDEGLPLFQSIIAVGGVGRKPQIIALLIQQTIIGSSEFVTGLTNVQTTYDSVNRAFSYTCEAETAFGTVTVQYNPGNLAVLPK